MISTLRDVEKVSRKVLNVYSDDLFTINLSWIDHGITMVNIPKYQSHQIIDRPIKINKIKKIHKTNFPPSPIIKSEGHHPKLNDIVRPKGRPTKIEQRVRQNLLGSIHSAKTLLSNDTIKHYRLVILKTIKSNDQNIKYSITEVSSLYLPMTELIKLKDFSWQIITFSEISYLNPDLKLEKWYKLPSYFREIDFFSEKEVLRRKTYKEEQKLRIIRLKKEFKEFNEYFNTYLHLIYGTVSINPKLQTKSEDHQIFYEKYFAINKKVNLYNATFDENQQFNLDLADLIESEDIRMEKENAENENKIEIENLVEKDIEINKSGDDEVVVKKIKKRRRKQISKKNIKDHNNTLIEAEEEEFEDDIPLIPIKKIDLLEKSKQDIANFFNTLKK